MKSIGICIGASNISLAVLEKKNERVNLVMSKSESHDGNPRQYLKRLFESNILDGINSIAITGRKLRYMLKAPSISEPEAVEIAYSYIKKEVGMANIIVSAGGETFMVYELDKTGKIIDVFTGNKCASGTGEFFLQQIKRMNLTIEEAIEIADIDNPYRVAGRCSVFCKSDCTHALNKGASRESVVAGLCEMMAGKITELLKSTDYKNVLVIGGNSENSVMMEYLRRKIPNIIVPEYAKTFEAFGAALWAFDNVSKPERNVNKIFTMNESSFSFHRPLYEFEKEVIFKDSPFKKAEKGDMCILGLDVGSTTTKAVLIRKKDNAILASCYLRTNGDPIAASRECYRKIAEQVNEEIEIIGIGVTGSGRQIAGLHALTPSVINEIVAHATAAVYYDSDVDTIFEIGGQDAKYTYLTNGVPSDYAMNEACSAGTGSFLEEAAHESLKIKTEEIGNIALKSKMPPNFNDQCAAFISSDIKSAIQEGLEPQDIAAGLVYSICLNYINRVKGNRTVGKKIFMQGGVCYNKAVPIAMAALTGKTIVVPPHPGLMGAFGVALEVVKRLDLNLLKPSRYDLKELINREVSYKEPFICAGGNNKCDRKCSINRIVIENKIYPFGGACNKYYNILKESTEYDTEKLDLVALREKFVFEKYSRDYAKSILPNKNKTVGINLSLLTNTLYPLYYNFFSVLGYKVVLSPSIDKQGMEKKGSSFCYPVEISHGALHSLISLNTDILFLPHVKALPAGEGVEASVTCPFVQAEPYYLKTAFSDELKDKVILSPVLDFSKGYETQEKIFIDMAEKIGEKREYAKEAFKIAVEAQKSFLMDCKKIGKEVLIEIDRDPEKIAIVMFGRPYNAFTKNANMGIPKKFASRGFLVIPIDFLPVDDEENHDNMYWAMGMMILKATNFVKRHPRLFGTYVTNFSCGPDSFVNGYFRDNMGRKPSLTLELDSHTADAGIDTRIEAFIDVIKSYLQISKQTNVNKKETFNPAKIVFRKGKTLVIDSSNKEYALEDPRVHVLIPSMGHIGSRLLAATLRNSGIKSTAVPEPAEEELKIGRGYASCKECLPLILTVGSLIKYIKENKKEEEVLVYFMPETSGPCRFGQYNVLIRNIINKLELKNTTTISLSSENSYAGLGTKTAMRAWISVIISDVLEEIYSAVITLSKDRQQGINIFNEVVDEIVYSVENQSWKGILQTINKCASKLKSLDLKASIHETPKVALIGEIYVRRDAFSRQYLVEKLADKNIIVKTAPISEWIYYCDYIVKNKLVVKSNLKDRLRVYIQEFFKNPFEKKIKEAFSKSGLYEMHLVDIEKLINNVKDIVSPRLTGETILTTGAAISEIIEEVSGVISIGPFGCMPGRIAEAVICETINEKKLEAANDRELVRKVLEKYPSLPFLSIETDGNTFPQIINSKLETFCLQVERINKYILELRTS